MLVVAADALRKMDFPGRGRGSSLLEKELHWSEGPCAAAGVQDDDLSGIPVKNLLLRKSMLPTVRQQQYYLQRSLSVKAWIISQIHSQIPASANRETGPPASSLA